ncbi:hypothetical protein DRX41_24385 [Salmonella enterica subsp. enterica]|nr:hypothetical protein [Salmonella enterica subsp. enterica serovar Mikawasima]ECD2236987.1 hypothetical protein [Salmonella enterica subsp. enterica serovar Offa]
MQIPVGLIQYDIRQQRRLFMWLNLVNDYNRSSKYRDMSHKKNLILYLMTVFLLCLEIMVYTYDDYQMLFDPSI